MKLTKYPQSCVLIEHRGKRILIDPGRFVYEKTSLQPADWKGIDALLLTHEHEDHTQPDAVKTIVENNHCPVLTNSPVAHLLWPLGIQAILLRPGDEWNKLGFPICGVTSYHGPMPMPVQPPEVIGFLIDKYILHPGDTLYVDPAVQARVLLLPMCDTVTFSPRQAAAYAARLKPELVIPIHYHNEKFNTDTTEYARILESYDVPFKIMKEEEMIEC